LLVSTVQVSRFSFLSSVSIRPPNSPPPPTQLCFPPLRSSRRSLFLHRFRAGPVFAARSPPNPPPPPNTNNPTTPHPKFPPSPPALTPEVYPARLAASQCAFLFFEVDLPAARCWPTNFVLCQFPYTSSFPGATGAPFGGVRVSLYPPVLFNTELVGSLYPTILLLPSSQEL